jgi:polyisoprenyl-teichoic acid--peptidoglycan teichoic acid transferase
MTRSEWIAAALLLLAFGIVLGALLIAGDYPAGFVLPTLAPTLSLPALPSPTLTFTPLPSPTVTPAPPPSPTATFTPGPTATPTHTPTPAPTPTSFSLDVPQLIEVTAAATLSDTTAIPSPVPTAVIPPNTINVVVLGSDRRPDWNDWHTDVVQIVSIQTGVPAVTVLSIPRDLYVYIPEQGMSRINFADMYGEVYGYEGGGPDLIQQTLLYNLGIPIDHYVRTDFDGLIGIVDALGGVDIPVHCKLMDYWPYPNEAGEYITKTLEPGMHHLDGESALWYARSRKTSSTFARERRQQQVLQAIWRKSRSFDIVPRIPELWEQFRSMIVTDMTITDMVRLAEMATRLDEQNVRFRNIGYQHVIPWTTPKGGSVFLPNWEEIGPVVSEALGPVPEGRLWRTLQSVEVWNGTDRAGWDQLAADRLFREGFSAIIGQPDRRDYAQTQLIDLTSLTKGSATSYLRWMFNVSPENVITASDPNAPAQYCLIIGADFETCRRP